MWKRADLEQGNSEEPVATLALEPSIPENFTFTPDGKALLGNSYYTGVSNVFRFDIATGKYEVLTNASTGFFRPQLRPDGSLLVYDYTGEGFNPSIVQPQVREDLAVVRLLGNQVVTAHPELKQWGVGSPAKVQLDQLITERGTYDPLKRMRFDAHYPIVSGYDRKAAVGYYFHLADPLQFRQLSASVAVSPYKVKGSERLHADLEFQTPYWKLKYWHNLADVYDLAGPVLRSRKGDAFIASYNRPLIYDPPRQLDVFGSASAYFGSRGSCRARRTSPAPRTCARARSACAIPTPPRRWAASIMRKASPGASSPARTRRRDMYFPRLYGGFDVGTRAAVEQQLGVALRACRPGRRPAPEPARRLLFRLVPQQLRR